MAKKNLNIQLEVNDPPTPEEMAKVKGLMANFFPYLANDIIYQMEGHEPPKVDPILAFANDVFKEKEDKLYGFLLKHCRKEELEQLKADIYQHIINEQEGDISTDLIKKFRDRLGVTPKFLK